MNKYPLIYVITAFICLSGTTSAAEDVEQQMMVERPLISAHGRVGRAWLPEVMIIADDIQADEEELFDALEPEIRKQLRYLVGNLHSVEGGLELHRAEISDVERVEKLADGQVRYRYSVSVNAVISKNPSIDLSGDHLSVVLPKRSDEEGLRAFFDQFGADCIPNPHKTYDAEHYWYYFRPLAYYCPLATERAEEIETAFVTDVYFEEDRSETSDISPRYQDMWRDGKLEITAVYALVGGLLGEQGQEAYQMVFKELIRTYGTPLYIHDESLLNAGRLDIDRPVIHAIFETPKGPLEVHLFLINSLDEPSHEEGDPLQNFNEEYHQLMQVSDFMIYNGHARYGSDNAKLDQLGSVRSDHYQLFFVNTCASYNYGLPRIRGAYQKANQHTAQPDAFLDLILNAMPAMGHEIAYMNSYYINALVEGRASFKTLLADLYPKQQMLVLSGQRVSGRSMTTDGVKVDEHQLDTGARSVGGTSSGFQKEGCDQSTKRRTPLSVCLVLLWGTLGLLMSQKRARRTH